MSSKILKRQKNVSDSTGQSQNWLKVSITTNQPRSRSKPHRSTHLVALQGLFGSTRTPYPNLENPNANQSSVTCRFSHKMLRQQSIKSRETILVTSVRLIKSCKELQTPSIKPYRCLTPNVKRSGVLHRSTNLLTALTSLKLQTLVASITRRKTQARLNSSPESKTPLTGEMQQTLAFSLKVKISLLAPSDPNGVLTSNQLSPRSLTPRLRLKTREGLL